MLLLVPDRTGNSVTSELARRVVSSLALLLSGEIEDILKVDRCRNPLVVDRGVEDTGVLGLLWLLQPRWGHLGAEYKQEPLRCQNYEYKERGGDDGAV